MIIVEIYVQDEEIKNIMQVYDLTENDFQVIYYHLFDSYEFHELLFVENEYQSAKHLLFVKPPTGQTNAPAEQNGVGQPLFVENEPCLFATALLLDLNSIIAIANRVKSDKSKNLLEAISVVGQTFFYEHAVQQNIVSVQHFCRNGICDKLKK